VLQSVYELVMEVLKQVSDGHKNCLKVRLERFIVKLSFYRILLL